jgi:hypothetical protein
MHPEGALLPGAKAQAAESRRPRRQPAQLHIAHGLVEAQRQRLAPGVAHSFLFHTAWVTCPKGGTERRHTHKNAAVRMHKIYAQLLGYYLKWSFQWRQTRRYDAQAATSSLAEWPLTSGCCGADLTALLPLLVPLPDGQLESP